MTRFNISSRSTSIRFFINLIHGVRARKTFIINWRINNSWTFIWDIICFWMPLVILFILMRIHLLLMICHHLIHFVIYLKLLSTIHLWKSYIIYWIWYSLLRMLSCICLWGSIIWAKILLILHIKLISRMRILRSWSCSEFSEFIIIRIIIRMKYLFILTFTPISRTRSTSMILFMIHHILLVFIMFHIETQILTTIGWLQRSIFLEIFVLRGSWSVTLRSRDTAHSTFRSSIWSNIKTCCLLMMSLIRFLLKRSFIRTILRTNVGILYLILLLCLITRKILEIK